MLCRCAKALRTIEDIMENEQELANVESTRASPTSGDAAVALATVVGSSDTVEVAKALQEGPAANTTNDMELCSTAKLLLRGGSHCPMLANLEAMYLCTS